MSDRGRDVSHELTEVRTVLSRAETAYQGISIVPGRDPDAADMRMSLAEVIRILDRWRRTGRPEKRECPRCGDPVTVAHRESGKLDSHYARNPYRCCE